MEELSLDRKVAIIVISITLVVIVAILFVTGAFKTIFKNYKKDNMIKCIETKMDGVVNYKNISCTLTDEEGKTYTLAYPRFDDDNITGISTINSEFRKKYDNAIKNISYHEDRELEKIKVYHFNELNYKTITFNNYLFIIGISNMILDSGYRYDYSYNIEIIDLGSKTRISQDEFINNINLSNGLSSKVKRTVLDIYLKKYKYNYEYEASDSRNAKLDASYEAISLENIRTFYYDASGHLSFILYLYDVTSDSNIPYFFRVNSNGEVNYSENFY